MRSPGAIEAPGNFRLQGAQRMDSSSRPKWMNIGAQMHDHVMHLTGLPARQFYFHAPTIVEAFAEVAAYYQMDYFRAVGDSYNFEVEAMGAKMVYSDHAMPTVDFRDPLVKEPSDLLKLKPPDFLKDGRLPFALDCMRLSAQRSGAPSGSFCAPFSMAVAMRGYPALVKDIRRRPGFYRNLMDFIADRVVIPYLKVQHEHAGIVFSGGANAWATVPNLSPAELTECSVPWSRRVIEAAAAFGVTANGGEGSYNADPSERFDPRVLHESFDVQVASAGAPRLALGGGLWHEYPLESVRDYTAKYRARGIKVLIAASINARLLRDGPVERIVDLVKRYIKAFAWDHELVMSIANIPADTPSDHVHAAVAAVHTYGQLPLPDDPDDIDAVQFAAPRRESFTEWRARQSR